MVLVSEDVDGEIVRNSFSGGNVTKLFFPSSLTVGILVFQVHLNWREKPGPVFTKLLVITRVILRAEFYSLELILK
jgi:hypothetical protein